MLVTRIGLQNFRNYSNLDLELSEGPTLLVGNNGQGKTNLVESIYYLGNLGSHRVSTDQALVKQGEEFAIIRANVSNLDIATLLEVQINRNGSNRAKINKQEVPAKQLPRFASVVLFAPEDLVLVRGEPGSRRRFMDELLVRLKPRFGGILSDYDRVLRQRNSLLKSSKGKIPTGGESTLEIWDEKLVELGSQIIWARAELINYLQPEVTAAYSDVAGSTHTINLYPALSLFGATSIEDDDLTLVKDLDPEVLSEKFHERIVENRKAELERGVTLVGPHRDDLSIQLNGMPSRGYSSHGESWSLALALKLASANLIKHDSLIGDPVLVLDDVFAELDESRRERLAEAVLDFQQILVTAAVAKDVPLELSARIVPIASGQVAPTN